MIPAERTDGPGDLVLARPEYVPSRRGWAFHASPARFRYLVAGVKSGKSRAGAEETFRAAAGEDGGLVWVVAPTYGHLRVAEREFLSILLSWPDALVGRHRARHEVVLANGTAVEFKSADNPDNLRGPNVRAIWADEASWIKPEAWHVLRERVSATGGEIWATTTPKGRNWVWEECQKAGMPADAPYGEFASGNRWVGHWPTWEFGWVAPSEVEEARASLPAEVFAQEYGAEFLTSGTQVFRGIEESLFRGWPPREEQGGSRVLGVDLAKHQDWTAVVVLSVRGVVLHVDRWSEVEWRVQRPRILALAREWGAGIVLDRSNVGSAIEEDLRAEGNVPVEGADLNSPQLKTELIQTLQVAFEHRRVKIPDPRWAGAPSGARVLVDELKWYEHRVTRGGRLSYSAPRGLTDDCVMALALANWGLRRGAAGGVEPAASAVAKDAIVRERGGAFERLLRGPRAPRLTSIFGGSAGGIFGRSVGTGASARRFWK